MMRAHRLIVVCLVLSFPAACRSPGGDPLILYGGAVRPPAEISVIRIARTSPLRGHPTLDVRKITRLDLPSRIIFQVNENTGWQIPSHFAGPPDPGRRSSTRDPRDLPEEFHLVPGTYQIDFLYVPVIDRWGWTHTSEKLSTVRLSCEPGFSYLLEGTYLEGGGGWILKTSPEPYGAHPPQASGGRP